jgi:hypothetical protein
MNIEVKVIEVIKEDATATVSGSAGMGAVTATQPSTNSGTTIGTAFTSGGGTIGSGDVSNPLLRAPFEKPHGSKRNKKFNSIFKKAQDYTKSKNRKRHLKKFSDFSK